MFEKVENMKRPLMKGEKCLVPCIVREEDSRLFITPVINHPHNDKENGPHHVHYHVDYRFVKHYNDKDFPTVVNTEIIREWSISDFVVNGDKVLVKWVKRFQPLSDMELKEQYGR